MKNIRLTAVFLRRNTGNKQHTAPPYCEQSAQRKKYRCKVFSILCVPLFLGMVAPVVAQENVSQAKHKKRSNTSPTTTEETVRTTDNVASTLEAINDALEAQQDETNALKQKLNEQEAKIEQLSEELAYAAEEREEIQISQMNAPNWSEEKRFSVYGFMDANFAMAIPQRKNGEADWSSPMFVRTSRRSSFFQTGVNLYFKSELSPTLETLVETQFTFQPNGNVTSYPRVVHLSGGAAVEDGEWERTDTSVRKHYTGVIRLGGILIERAQIDWKPRDWFRFRAGRFLSPFGIWHENHGAPVQLSATDPFIISNNYLPNAQTGIMLGGTVFPSDTVDLEYAVTLSNGRGPFDEFKDLDNNKALGLRAKINVRLTDFFASAGAYGYMGQYTDSINSLHVYTNATSSGFDESVEQPTQWVEQIISKYDEKILATELQFKYKGFHLLGEYIVGHKEYVVPTEIYAATPLFVGAAHDVDAVEANHFSQAWYVAVAYQLPFERVLKDVKITPFVKYDHLEPSDVYSYDSAWMVEGGINIKPSPYLTLKASTFCIIPIEKRLLGDNTWYWSINLAVSF